MSLVAGSYERFIWGYKLKSRKHSQTLALTPLFSFPSHLSTIKAVAVFGSAAVSGGNDDTLKIYDLSTSSEIGSLHHTSSITSLAFYSPPSISLEISYLPMLKVRSPSMMLTLLSISKAYKFTRRLSTLCVCIRRVGWPSL